MVFFNESLSLTLTLIAPQPHTKHDLSLVLTLSQPVGRLGRSTARVFSTPPRW